MADENGVATAFDMLLEEIENAIEGLNVEGAEAFRKPDYDIARALMARGSQMTAIRERVNELRIEWGNAFSPGRGRRRRRRRRTKATARLGRGLRTREDAFRAPILKALVHLGGSAPMTEVLDRVGDVMEGQLNEYDRSPLPTTPGSPRWRNTAQWARNAMVREGLLSSGSPRGTWDITEAGERWLGTHADDHLLSLLR